MKSQSYRSVILVLVSLALLTALVGGTWNTAYGAGPVLQSSLPRLASAALAIPTFQIVSVQVDQSVTIQTYNFPANDTFNVRMNVIGTQGVGGYTVQTINSGAGGSFTATYNIPNELKGQRQIAIRLESPTSGYFAYNWFWNNTSGLPVTGPGLPPGVIPTFSITSVDVDNTVTISTSNFPANDNFEVRMNYIGTRGVGGTLIETFNSGTGGTFSRTIAIPAGLKGQRQIAIRLESPTSGYFAYNWFWNNTSGGVPVSGPTLPPGVIPTFSITEVVRDGTVTIRTANFPANDTFNVLMNYMGTRGVGGVQVDTINSGTGGTMVMTFNIPDAMKGQSQIAIRLESPTSRYFAYNWFWNNSTSGVPVSGPTLPPGVVPSTTMLAVTRDVSVTVETNNFPANDTFEVFMGEYGTQGVGGIKVDTITTDGGGSFRRTFAIPASLQGRDRIAIRLQSPTSGYFAYNWFWNNTYP